MGRDSRVEQINDLAEDTLAALGEQRVFGKQRAQIVRLITGLEEAGRIDVERAEFRVKKARAELHEAEDDLARVRETNGHEAEALLELVQLSAKEDRALEEDVRQVSLDVKGLGATYVRPELVGAGELQQMVERRQAMVERRRRVRAAGASKPEVEVV